MVAENSPKFDDEPEPFSVGRDLHAHLSGSISAVAIYDLIYKNGFHIKHKGEINAIIDPFGIKLADDIENNSDQAREQFIAAYTCPPNGKNRFEEVMQRFNLTSFLLQLPGIKSQVGETVTRDFQENGVTYVEWRVDPFSGTQHETAEEGFNKLSEYYSGMKESGLESRFVLSVSKSRYGNGREINEGKINFLAKQVRKMLELGREFPIVGLDVGGAETVPISAFRPYFDLARIYGLGITPHVGEGTTTTIEDGLEDIATAIDFGAGRLGHAILAYISLDKYLETRDKHGRIYDASRIKALKVRQAEIEIQIKTAKIAVEVCPTSNLSAHLGLHSYREHPIDRLIELGIPYVICSDDSGIFGTTLRQEIAAITQAKKLKIKQVIDSANIYSFS